MLTAYKDLWRRKGNEIWLKACGVTLVLHSSRNEQGTVLQVGVEAHEALHLKSYGIHHEPCSDHPTYGAALWAALWAVAECRLYGGCNNPCWMRVELNESSMTGGTIW